jgi:cell division protein FtsQ
MWNDARQLTAVSLALVAVAALLAVWGALSWAVRQPAFAFREVVVTTPLAHASGAHLESVVREELAGTLFTLDLDRAKRALVQVPWVRSVGLRRQWPGRLEIEIEEHAPLARWNGGGLVNTRGEVFIADWNGDLPIFAGPDGDAALMTARYREWDAMLSPLALSVRTLTLSARGGWEIGAAGPQETLTIELAAKIPRPPRPVRRCARSHGRASRAFGPAGDDGGSALSQRLRGARAEFPRKADEENVKGARGNTW